MCVCDKKLHTVILEQWTWQRVNATQPRWTAIYECEPTKGFVFLLFSSSFLLAYGHDGQFSSSVEQRLRTRERVPHKCVNSFKTMDCWTLCSCCCEPTFPQRLIAMVWMSTQHNNVYVVTCSCVCETWICTARTLCCDCCLSPLIIELWKLIKMNIGQ